MCPQNLAPEVMLRWAQAAGAQADVWAFGMTLMELCLQAAEPLMQDVRPELYVMDYDICDNG